MIPCLLCSERWQCRQTFSEIFFFQPPESGICFTCKESFAKIGMKHCPSCFKEGEERQCQDCRYWKTKGKSVSHKSLYQYNGAMADYFSRYKFGGDYLLRKVFARELRQLIGTEKGISIVPVPLSPERLAERGFNQVEGLLTAAGINYHSLLEKTEIAKQSDKNRKGRLQTEQCFYLREGAPVPKNILLVDDIYTTGQTIQLAKAVLLENGAKTVHSVSLAR